MGRKHTCVDSNGRVRARGVNDGAGYGRARERTEREDGDGRADAAPDVRRVTEGDERRGDETHECAGRHAVDDCERDERSGAVCMWPDKGQGAREEGRGRHDVEWAWCAVGVL